MDLGQHERRAHREGANLAYSPTDQIATFLMSSSHLPFRDRYRLGSKQISFFCLVGHDECRERGQWGSLQRMQLLLVRGLWGRLARS